MSTKNTNLLSSKDVFTCGIACYAIMAANHIGIFQELEKYELRVSTFLEKNKSISPAVLDGILRSLAYAGIIDYQDESYKLTELGKDIIKDLPSYLLWFEGYSTLLSKQNDIISGKDDFKYEYINSPVVADNSAAIGRLYADSQLKETIRMLNPKSLSDLGCGNGTRLITLCEEFKVPGYGFDVSKQAINLARTNALKATQPLTFTIADVTNITGVWEDIELLMQTFMTHHIIPDTFCESVFLNYKSVFPKMKYFLILEVVSSEEISSHIDNFAPGFDYIHRLQGFTPRTRKEALNIFKNSGYGIIKEIQLHLTNGYLWVLKA